MYLLTLRPNISNAVRSAIPVTEAGSKLTSSMGLPLRLPLSSLLPVLQLAADAEHEDNISEQKRQNGKRVRYGEVIQVRQLVYLDHVGCEFVTTQCASVVHESKHINK